MSIPPIFWPFLCIQPCRPFTRLFDPTSSGPQLGKWVFSNFSINPLGLTLFLPNLLQLRKRRRRPSTMTPKSERQDGQTTTLRPLTLVSAKNGTECSSRTGIPVPEGPVVRASLWSIRLLTLASILQVSRCRPPIATQKYLRIEGETKRIAKNFSRRLVRLEPLLKPRPSILVRAHRFRCSPSVASRQNSSRHSPVLSQRAVVSTLVLLLLSLRLQMMLTPIIRGARGVVVRRPASPGLLLSQAIAQNVIPTRRPSPPLSIGETELGGWSRRKARIQLPNDPTRSLRLV